MFLLGQKKRARPMRRDVLPENRADVFPDFKLGWIDARAFSEPLGEKTKRPLVCQTKVFLGIYSRRGTRKKQLTRQLNNLCLIVQASMNAGYILVLCFSMYSEVAL